MNEEKSERYYQRLLYQDIYGNSVVIIKHDSARIVDFGFCMLDSKLVLDFVCWILKSSKRWKNSS